MFTFARICGLAPFELRLDGKKHIFKPSVFWSSYSVLVCFLFGVSMIAESACVITYFYRLVIGNSLVLVRVNFSLIAHLASFLTHRKLCHAMNLLFPFRKAENGFILTFTVSVNGLCVFGNTFCFRRKDYACTTQTPPCNLLYWLGMTLPIIMLTAISLLFIDMVSVLTDELRSFNMSVTRLHRSGNSASTDVGFGHVLGGLKQRYNNIVEMTFCLEDVFAVQLLILICTMFLQTTVYMYYYSVLLFNSGLREPLIATSSVVIGTMLVVFLFCGRFADTVCTESHLMKEGKRKLFCFPFGKRRIHHPS